MMGRQDRDQRQLFYEFRLEEMIPAGHLLRRINVFATAVLADLHEQLKAFYSDLGRPSVDPELLFSAVGRPPRAPKPFQEMLLLPRRRPLRCPPCHPGLWTFGHRPRNHYAGLMKQS
jgi:hypothetical protein